MHVHRHLVAAVLSTAAFLLLAACGTARQATIDPEEFDSNTTHTRNFAASQAQTCEAARRALLSQGYLLTSATAEQVTGRKSFQPAAETHVEVELRVVCATDTLDADRHSIAFATALQDRYGIKKVNNSASVGVGALGSLSLPFAASDEAMVKIASETVTDAGFYERFFGLLQRYLEPARKAPAPLAKAPAEPTTRSTPVGEARPAGLQTMPVRPPSALDPVESAPLVPVPPTASRG